MFKILTVEDSTEYRNSLSNILKAKFPTVQLEQARNSDEALMALKREVPDLVFMDIHLGGTNGLDLTRLIKSCYSQVTVIVLTNHDLPEYKEAAFRAGASFFLTKSILADDLYRVVQSIIEKQDHAEGSVC